MFLRLRIMSGIILIGYISCALQGAELIRKKPSEIQAFSLWRKDITMKKIITLFMAQILLLSLFTGCAKSDEKSFMFDNDSGSPKPEYNHISSDEEMNTEEYSAIVENGYMSAKNNPLSTFSIDVDTASYANVRRMLNSGQSVPKDAVRVEEFINYFKYQYPEPEGTDPFSITAEISECPWNENTKLMLIGLKTREIASESLPQSNLVFLVDVSGSMSNYDKLPLIQSAFMLLTQNLKSADRISIVTYAGTDSVLLEGATGDEKLRITDAINSLTAGGSTAGADGINTAYKIAEKYFIEGGNNRIILATDGDMNVGITSESELKRLVEKKRDSGIGLSVLGFGTGNIKDNKMETLADNGNGNYSYIDSINEAKKVLIEEMGGTLFTVASDVKIQVEFNPSQIKGYRLIGYENRLLNSEDFSDDTKDAGEIGAGTCVTALYEIVLPDSAQEIRETELQYQKGIPADSSDWLNISIRYKDKGSSESLLLEKSIDRSDYKSASSENMIFAGNVAQFAMLLRDSEYRGTASYNKILQSLDDIKASFRNDEYKTEFYQLVKN